MGKVASPRNCCFFNVSSVPSRICISHGNYSGSPLAPPAAAREREKERFLGYSQRAFFSSPEPPAAARERKREISRGHPLYPAKGLPPLGTPLKLTPMGDTPRQLLRGGAGKPTINNTVQLVEKLYACGCIGIVRVTIDREHYTRL